MFFLLKVCASIQFVGVSLILFALVACGSGGGGGPAPTTPPQEPTATFSLSGSVVVKQNSDIDKDVEQRFENFTESNNSTGQAQTISNPVSIGGYISGLEGCYSNENCFQVQGSLPTFLKDPQDFFRVSLVAGQQISLSVFYADFSGETSGNIDVSLFLRPVSDPVQDDGQLIFDAEATKTLTVNTMGEYFIEINAAENISSPVLYTLSISESLLGNSLNVASINLASKFVPGEVIVKFKGDNGAASIAADSAISRQRTATNHGLKIKNSLGKGVELCDIDPPVLNKALSFEPSTNWPDSLKKKWQTLKTIEHLRSQVDVLYAEPNYIRSVTAVPDDPEYAQQWSLPMLELPAAWDVSTGLGAIVAVIDTGIDQDHLDLIDNILNGDSFDFIQNAVSAGDNDGPDPDPRDLGDSFHGSHVAGIIAAEGNNALGVAGVAYDASLLILRALGVKGEGTDADIASAILYAAGLPNSSGNLPTQKADIINLSLGSPDISETLRNAVEDALAVGVIVIAAAGNNSTDVEFYPAAFPGVIAVSSVTDNKKRSSFSNFGDWIDVAAPGGGGSGTNGSLFDGFQDGILSTIFASEYSELMGTSMAAPHISGVAALIVAKPTLMEERCPSAILTPASCFENVLNSGSLTDDIGTAQSFGNGLINAAKAMSWLGGSIPASLNAFPIQFGFVGPNTEADLTLTNPGTQGSVLVTEIQTSDPWIEVAGLSSVDSITGLGTYTVRVDGTQLAANSTVAGKLTILFEIDSVVQPALKIPIFVSDPQQTEDTVGRISIYLLRKEDVDATGSGLTGIFAAVVRDSNNGVYDYTLPGIPPGEYFLEASTDNDGDSIVFDAGEARGAYPLFSQNNLITVREQNIQDLNFEIQYQSFAQSSSLSSELQQENSMPLIQQILNGQMLRAPMSTPSVLKAQ